MPADRRPRAASFREYRSVELDLAQVGEVSRDEHDADLAIAVRNRVRRDQPLAAAGHRDLRRIARVPPREGVLNEAPVRMVVGEGVVERRHAVAQLHAHRRVGEEQRAVTGKERDGVFEAVDR